MDKKILDLLYRSLDSELNQSEKMILKEALENSDELKLHKQSLLEIRHSLKNIKSKKFSNHFADNVIQEIEIINQQTEDELFFESIFTIFKPIAIAAVFLIAFLISYNIFSNNEKYNNTEITLVEAFDPFNEFTLE